MLPPPEMTRLFPAIQRNDIIALIVASAFFMEVLDATIIAPAIPEMALALGTTPAALSSGISAYLITVAIFIPVSGWAADRFGTRNLFCAAIALFTVSSVACALSNSLPEFVAARIFQGIGGAMMSPVGRMEVLRRTPKDRFMRVVAMMSWPGLSGFIVGPPLGGFITTYASWRWIFLINIPLGLIAIALVWTYFERAVKTERRPFDWTGFGLLGGGLGVLMLGLEVLAHRNEQWALGTSMLAAGAILLTLAVRHVTHHPHPLVSIEPLKIPTFNIAFLSAGSLFRISTGATGFVFPTLFQIGFGHSAFDAGLLMLGFATGDLSMKLRATYFVRRYGLRPVLIWNGLLIGLSTLVMVLLYEGMPFWLMFGMMFLAGMFRSQQFTALSAMGFADVPHDRMANATALSNMLHQVSFGAGVALSAVMLVVTASFHSTPGTPLTVFDFRVVIVLMALMAFASVPIYLRLHPDAGAAISGHKRGESNE